MIFSDDETAALDADVINLGLFFRLETDPVVRLWLGFGDIEPGINVLDTEGATYTGFGEIGTLPALSQLINGAAERIEFVLSGVSGDLLKIASGGDAEQVKGKRVSVGIMLLCQDWQPLGSIKWMRHLTADFLSLQQQPVTDMKQAFVRTISLSCGSLLTARRRPNYSYFTDQDQQGRHPGDRFCERTSVYANDFQKTWPRY
ncbi:MAG: hypothetical protein J0H40_17695 [Rhizobiales bacterium]|nr:hypothetical protein [Hyphomicrobiales bacterium]